MSQVTVSPSPLRWPGLCEWKHWSPVPAKGASDGELWEGPEGPLHVMRVGQEKSALESRATRPRASRRPGGGAGGNGHCELVSDRAIGWRDRARGPLALRLCRDGSRLCFPSPPKTRCRPLTQAPLLCLQRATRLHLAVTGPSRSLSTALCTHAHAHTSPAKPRLGSTCFVLFLTFSPGATGPCPSLASWQSPEDKASSGR